MTIKFFFKKLIYSYKSVLTAFAVCTLMVILSFNVNAAELSGNCGSNVNWNLEDGILTISGDGRMVDFTDAHMPPWLEVGQDIKKIVINEGVRTVGDYAFIDCLNVTQISLPESLERIGTSAFEGCSSLRGITFPEKLTTIDYHAFFGCSSFASVTVPYYTNTLGKGIFANCTGLVRATIEAPIQVLPAWTFYGCSSLTSISLPTSIYKIGEDALENCTSLEQTFYNGNDDYKENLQENIQKETGKDIVVSSGEMPKKSETVVVESSSGTIEKNEFEDNSYVKPDISAEIIRDVIEHENAKITSEVTMYPEGSVIYGSNTVKRDGSPKDYYLVSLHVVIENMDGWEEVISKVEDFANYPERLTNEDTEVSTVQITVEMLGNVQVSARFLKMLAGLPVKVTFYNPTGTMWAVECNELDGSVIKRDFKLDYTVEKADNLSKEQKRIVGYNVTYELKFTEDFPAKFSVLIPVGASFAKYDATLYKENKEWEKLQLVKVDNSGTTEFFMDSVKKKDSYMFSLDVKSAYSNEAIIPDNMQYEYGGLMGENGTRYVITGANSSWGMSGVQVTLIMVAVIIGTVLIVGVTVGIISRKKYAKLDAEYYAERND